MEHSTGDTVQCRRRVEDAVDVDAGTGSGAQGAPCCALTRAAEWTVPCAGRTEGGAVLPMLSPVRLTPPLVHCGRYPLSCPPPEL